MATRPYVDLLPTAAAAAYLGLSAAWLKKSRTAKFGPHIDAPPFIKLGARRIAYRLEDLDDWLLAHRHTPGPKPDLP